MSLKFSLPKYQRKVNEKEGPLVLAQNTECNLALLEDCKRNEHIIISAELGASVLHAIPENELRSAFERFVRRI
jgi:hypothetical protein